MVQTSTDSGSDAEAFVSGGIPGPVGGARTTGDPIGVPEGYQAAVPSRQRSEQYGQQRVPGRPYYEERVTTGPWRSTIENRTPLYSEGMQHAPAARGVEYVANLQLRLMRAGILNKDFHVGVWDNSSTKAYEHLLTYANSAGLTWEQALANYEQGFAIDPETGQRIGIGGGGRGGSVKRAPLVIQTTSADDLAAVADNVWQETLGRKATEQEMQQFIRSYHSTESSVQRRAYNLDLTGGTVEAPPDPSVAAENLARTGKRQVEAEGHDLAGVFDSFLRVIGGND